MQVHLSGVEHPPAFPPGRDPQASAHRDEKQADLTAIAVTVFQHVQGNAFYGRVFPGTCPGIRPANVGEDLLELQERVGLFSHYAFCQFRNGSAGKDMGRAGLGVFPVRGAERVVGQQVPKRIKMMVLCQCRIGECIFKYGIPVLYGRLLHVYGFVDKRIR